MRWPLIDPPLLIGRESLCFGNSSKRITVKGVWLYLLAQAANFIREVICLMNRFVELLRLRMRVH